MVLAVAQAHPDPRGRSVLDWLTRSMPSADATITVGRGDERAVVTATGILCLEAVPRAERALATAVGCQVPSLTIDLSGVEMIDAAGISWLERARITCGDLNVRYRLVLPPSLRAQLESAGVSLAALGVTPTQAQKSSAAASLG